MLGDCRQVMAGLAEASVDAVICDPPYGLGKEPDVREVLGHWLAGDDYQQSGGGFMGKTWDSFVPGPSYWTAAFRALKPGGHLLSFGGTRTYDLVALAIRLAGFEIRDSLHWIYGSGFPKSLDIALALDRRAGVTRADRGTARRGTNQVLRPTYHTAEKGQPVTDEAKTWAGWGTGLKPAHEPIVLARKPLPASVAGNVLANGTGALNVKGCEIGATGGTRQVVAKASASGDEATSYGASIGSAPGGNVPDGGRWPANLVLSHLEECRGNGPHHTDVLCAAGCPVAELNDASGESVSPPSRPRTPDPPAAATWSLGREGGTQVGHDDVGGAARFFYVAKPRRRERIAGSVYNLHPTVKPVTLMRWLCRLVTPPGGLILDPFTGSGSTGCAAMVEGFRFLGVEQDPESFETARARVADWEFAHPLRT